MQGGAFTLRLTNEICQSPVFRHEMVIFLFFILISIPFNKTSVFPISNAMTSTAIHQKKFKNKRFSHEKNIYKQSRRTERQLGKIENKERNIHTQHFKSCVLIKTMTIIITLLPINV